MGPVLDGIRVRRPSGRGGPRTRPDRVIADKGYRYPRCCQVLRQRHIPHTIPERRDQRTRRATRPGHPLAFDKPIYARRNVVERCINRLKQWRGLATRYEKRAVNYRAMVVTAALSFCCRSSRAITIPEPFHGARAWARRNRASSSPVGADESNT